MITTKKAIWQVASLVVTGLSVFSCQNESMDGESSFGLIQEKILTKSCATSGCHASNTDDAFVGHQLVLSAGEAYDNLVDVAPFNAEAKADNLMRVKPFDAHSSLLFHKIYAEDHHARSYGNPMPLGLPLLTLGQVEFIRLWIEAGAPEKGSVAPPALLDDTAQQEENFEPLTPPEAGKGLQLVVPKFSVEPNFEREFFVYKKLGNTSEILVNRFEIKMRQNSHHFILYDFEPTFSESERPMVDFVRDLRNTDGSLNLLTLIPMGYHVFIMGTQTPYLDYKLPDGVAIAFPANFTVDCNSHYVNKSNEEISGEIQVNLHTVPASSVQKIAHALNLSNTSLNLPAKARVTLNKTFVFERTISVLSLTSHTHQLAEKFVIRIQGGTRNGEIVYTNLDWHHPPLVNFNTPIVLNPGEGLTSEITYNNTKDNAVKFGLTSEDEMGIIFGYYIED